MTQLNHHCSLCGLLCPIPMAWPRSGHDLPDCSRLRSWLSSQDAAGGQVPGRGQTSIRLREHAQRLSQARSPLLWIESADVSATRAAVALAQVCAATVHVAQSPGEQNVAAVTAACGTFGTSLAELAAHADLIVHVGHRHLVELPRLAPRFLQGDAQAGSEVPRRHVLIGDQPPESWSAVAHAPGAREPLVLRWPRELWLDRFTRVLMAARGDGAPSNRALDQSDAAAAELAELLAASRYAVFVWDEDEFADELDRLIVERLFEIAQFISRVTRCSLLPLGSDPGRTTAKETLLWLTNVATTARYCEGIWMRPHLGAGVSLQDWQREHDWILCLRNLPSDRSLPDLQFQLTIDAACNRASGNRASDNRASGHRASLAVPAKASGPEAEVLYLAAVGWDAPGHLVRIDHAFGAHLDAVTANPPGLARADQILRELAACISMARVG